MSVDELFKAIDDLRETDLENLMCRARAARTRLNPSILSEQETTLLLKINHALPEELHQEFITLRDRRDADIIIDTEYEQLTEVSDRIEELTADRCFHTPIGCTGFPGWEDSSNNSRCDRQPLDRPSANLVWGSLHNQCRDSACLPVRQKMWHHQCAPSTLLR